MQQKPYSFPMPRIKDCIDCIGHSELVSKFDLLKGYWQVPLSESAKAISTFATHVGLYQYTVMPLRMRNASATFQQMINYVIAGLDGCVASCQSNISVGQVQVAQYQLKLKQFSDLQ